MASTGNLNGGLRPIDLARRHGLSTQAIRNYEDEGILPPADRLPSGQRRYGAPHCLALDAFVCLTKAGGRQAAARIVASVTAADLAGALEQLDVLHVELSRDRQTVRQIGQAIRDLPIGDELVGPCLTPIELARRLKVSTTTLRHWEQAGILNPSRQGNHRLFGSIDVRDADLAHLMRRGGSGLATICATIHELHAQGVAAPLPETVTGWKGDIERRALDLLVGTAALEAYRQSLH